ncbi:hypothetical protein J3459_014029 [Metarhizium acridum]|uniref:uncharacterized protein n=1 Tax=Metarhizium acridum TaxID=92637 RepID=UPI001C6ABFE6|nr:hypothetical protein J3458_021122 [Metarhizium acridum]KAG8415822.1 hypothetical protein J3459_014029 [Metarhizium acridum]
MTDPIDNLPFDYYNAWRVFLPHAAEQQTGQTGTCTKLRPFVLISKLGSLGGTRRADGKMKIKKKKIASDPRAQSPTQWCGRPVQPVKHPQLQESLTCAD